MRVLAIGWNRLCGCGLRTALATINAGLTLEHAMAFLGEVAGHPRVWAVTVCEAIPDHLDEEGDQLGAFAPRRFL